MKILNTFGASSWIPKWKGILEKWKFAHFSYNKKDTQLDIYQHSVTVTMRVKAFSFFDITEYISILVSLHQSYLKFSIFYDTLSLGLSISIHQRYSKALLVRRVWVVLKWIPETRGRTSISTPSTSAYTSSHMHVLVLVRGIFYLQLYLNPVQCACTWKKYLYFTRTLIQKHTTTFCTNSLSYHFQHATTIKNKYTRISRFDLQKSKLISTFYSSA